MIISHPVNKKHHMFCTYYAQSMKTQSMKNWNNRQEYNNLFDAWKW